MSELRVLNKDMLIKLIETLQSNLKFYAVFEAYGDIGGHINFELLGCFTAVNKAINYIKTLPLPKKCDYIWNDMTEDNHWIHVGSRENRIQSYCYGFGGYIIEKMIFDMKEN